MTETIIDLLRHGEPQGGSKYRGHAIDDPLTEKGWAQMREGTGSYRDWDVILTSPLRRCRRFAEELGGELSVSVQVKDDLREIGFGQWEGKTKQQLREERAREFDAFYRDPVNNTPQGAEPVQEFYQRIASVMDEVYARHGGKRALIVAHAGVIRAALTHAIGATPASMYHFNVRNGRISRIIRRDQLTTIELLNARL